MRLAAGDPEAAPCSLVVEVGVHGLVAALVAKSVWSEFRRDGRSLSQEIQVSQELVFLFDMEPPADRPSWLQNRIRT